MIISKKKYKAMIEVMEKQRECIRLLDEQCDILKKIVKKTTLSSIYGTMATKDIDFPATEKLHEDKLF